MKAWWSDRYTDENKAWLASVFEENTTEAESYFVATPSEIPWCFSASASFGSCRLLVCPFTTPPQNIPEGIKVIHLGGHPMLHKITPTVELTWQLILRLVRPIDAAIESVLEGQWDRFPFGAERMLSRMNLLVIGRGRIGSRVEVIGQAFGMNVKAQSRVNSIMSEDMIEEADIITIHTPPLDYPILGESEFRIMKQGVYIVNTAQGNAIDIKELLASMTSGNIGGAALDVIDDIEKLKILRFYVQTGDNLILTPHIGGSTKDAWHETQRMAIEMALEYLGLEDTENG